MPQLETSLQRTSGPAPGRAAAPPWLADLQTRHVRIAVPVTLFVAALSSLGRLPPGVEFAVLAGAVGVLGLPHGALDYLAGRALYRPRFGRAWPLPFATLYLGVAGLVVASWAVAPLLALLGFLAIAVAHFGLEDTDPALAAGAGSRRAALGVRAEALARGGLLVAAVLFVHPAEAVTLFGYLMPDRTGELAPLVDAIRRPLALVVFAGLALVLGHHARGWVRGSTEHGRTVAEIVSLGALFVLAPPLIAFVVYFCLWHSVRHSLEVAASLGSSGPAGAIRGFFRRAWPMTALALALAGVAFLLLVRAQAPGPAAVRVVFIGLSALTVPHIIVSWLAERARARRPRTAPVLGDLGADAARFAA